LNERGEGIDFHAKGNGAATNIRWLGSGKTFVWFVDQRSLIWGWNENSDVSIISIVFLIPWSQTTIPRVFELMIAVYLKSCINYSRVVKFELRCLATSQMGCPSPRGGDLPSSCAAHQVVTRQLLESEAGSGGFEFGRLIQCY
jgi:hypothetical protein